MEQENHSLGPKGHKGQYDEFGLRMSIERSSKVPGITTVLSKVIEKKPLEPNKYILNGTFPQWCLKSDSPSGTWCEHT